MKATAELKAKQGDETKLKSLNARDIEFEGLTRDNTNEKLFTKTVTLDSKQYTLQFELKSEITFSGQILRAPMRLSVKELGARHFYDFSSELQYTNNAFVDETEGNAYNLDKYPTFIDMVKNNTIDASYVVKISPLFMNKQVKNLKNENEEKKVLTFENTP
ncbi:Uncharacterised protein [Chlamydia trachomatis]|nr:Uncharacterised protein [Chlamydia trachomatis]